MFKITVFSNIKPNVLSNRLSSIRFVVDSKTEEIYWKGQNGESFIISPFHNQSRHGINGYRIYSDFPISTIIYLFDGSLGWIDDLKVSGIEYETNFTKNKFEHLNECHSNPSLQMVDSRGIFLHKDVMIVLLNNKIIMQRRTNIKKLNEELKKIEDVKDILFPASHDLFLFLEEVNVG